MIGLKMHGLLGNHMFQYAAMTSFGRLLGTDFFIQYGKTRMTKPRLHRYFELHNYNPWRNRWRDFYYRTLTRLPDRVFVQEVLPEHQLAELSDHLMYQGYFQSARYFDPIKTEVDKIFRIKKKYREQLKQLYGEFLAAHKVVVVHLRRTSYVVAESEQFGGNWALPLSYYHKALSLIDNIDQYKVIFISDDIEFVKEEFGTRDNYLYESNSEIIDFQLLMHADILILANSTFSWWGAFLNPKQDKLVYAPKYWLGFKVNQEYPIGIMDIDWHWIE